MVVYEVKKDKWAFKLASQLVGKAQQAYAGLSVTDASDYDQLKSAILRWYDITEESYRQRFRTAKPRPGEYYARTLCTYLCMFYALTLSHCKGIDEYFIMISTVCVIGN